MVPVFSAVCVQDAVSAGRFVLEGVLVGYAMFVLHIVREGEGVAVAEEIVSSLLESTGVAGFTVREPTSPICRPSASAVLIRHAHRVLARLAQRLERMRAVLPISRVMLPFASRQGVGHLNVVVLFAAQVHGQALHVSSGRL